MSPGRWRQASEIPGDHRRSREWRAPTCDTFPRRRDPRRFPTTPPLCPWLGVGALRGSGPQAPTCSPWPTISPCQVSGTLSSSPGLAAPLRTPKPPKGEVARSSPTSGAGRGAAAGSLGGAHPPRAFGRGLAGALGGRESCLPGLRHPGRDGGAIERGRLAESPPEASGTKTSAPLGSAGPSGTGGSGVAVRGRDAGAADDSADRNLDAGAADDSADRNLDAGAADDADSTNNLRVADGAAEAGGDGHVPAAVKAWGRSPGSEGPCSERSSTRVSDRAPDGSSGGSAGGSAASSASGPAGSGTAPRAPDASLQ